MAAASERHKNSGGLSRTVETGPEAKYESSVAGCCTKNEQ